MRKTVRPENISDSATFFFGLGGEMEDGRFGFFQRGGGVLCR